MAFCRLRNLTCVPTGEGAIFFLMQRTEGWTTRAIQAAARDLDFSPALAGVCKSEAELVEYFIRESNEALFQKIAEERPLWASKSSTDKIKMAVRWRLEMLEPYVGVAMLAPAHV